MAYYKAVFVKIDKLIEEDCSFYGLTADTAEAAEAEAMQLPAPVGANFVKVVRDGLVEFTIELSL